MKQQISFRGADIMNMNVSENGHNIFKIFIHTI